MPAEQARGARLVLFDLDGTLADTLPDLAWALNRALAEHGLASAPDDVLRGCVSRGARAMTQAAVGGRGDAEAVLERFLELYRDNIAVRSHLFCGMQRVLDAIDAAGLGAGVVTNKLTVFTDPLLRHLALDGRLRCVVSGDTAARAKPHPEPLLHAALAANVEPLRCVYVGDARGDVIASRAAGMPVAAACWGYLDAEDDPATWCADVVLREPSQLLDWLGLAD